MVPWWWLPIVWVIGALMGITAMAICAGNFDKAEERIKKEGR